MCHCENQLRHADNDCKNSFIIQVMPQVKGLLLFKAAAGSTDNQEQLLLWNLPQRVVVRVTVVLVGAVRVAVDDAGLSVRGPASVSDAEVREKLLLQVQWIFLWRRKGNIY